ncbi:hypothetical protein [Parvularcula sp. LCG005]|uniref:hypothetical protein n=1 Tax=Parvularcula sp. LCG005 TaxID=3078805 RepID=UPI0029424EF4|nr:hypothetical protein [Parvularcula sp. LCG005]WOI51973.1 hypothetical protein RUI03_07365 [Parvularcula sp. LCG005]
MGLLSSKKTSITENTSLSETTNQSVYGAGASVSTQGDVTIESTDHDSVMNAIALAATVSDDANELATSTVGQAFEASNQAQAQAFKAFAEADRTQTEQLFTDLSSLLVTLGFIIGGVIILPKIFKD